MTQSERAVAMVAAAGLHSLSRAAAAFVVLWLLAFIAWGGPPRADASRIALTVLVVATALLSAGLTLHLHFDARLFAALGRGEIADLASLDNALHALQLRPPGTQRAFAERLAGTRRLARRLGVALLMHGGACTAAVGIASRGA